METKTSKLYLSEELKRLTEENERLKERDTPKKVEHSPEVDDDMVVCPICSREFEIDYDEHCDYCPSCGQKLDWNEIEEILTKDEKEYLSAVIKPFRDRIIYIKKTIVFDGYGVDYAECISIILKYKDEEDITELPIFEEYSLYKGMEAEKEYTLEELGL